MESVQSTFPTISGRDVQQVPKWLLFLTAATVYLLIARYFRFRRIRSVENRNSKILKHPHSMSYSEAHAITRTTMLQEFPFLFMFATQWALIKSYGIASGTRLLVQTGRLTNTAVVGKRSEDTGLILAEILVKGVDSERGLKALSKMNWIHARYGSKITNDELIHTLALFVLEPHRWIDRFEWRPMTRLEKVAYFVYWKEIGNRMGMVDIPATLEELQAWTVEYEKTHMYYTEDNRKCYDATVALFIKETPKFMRAFAEKLTACFLQDYARTALGVPHPPGWLQSMVDGVLLLRGWLIRHTCLPRWREMDLGVRMAPNGRLQRKSFAFEPWYVKDTAWSKLLRRLGLANPRKLPGPEYMDDGYLPEELGPIEFIEKSRKPVLDQAEEMKRYAERGGAAGVGCPFLLGRR